MHLELFDDNFKQTGSLEIVIKYNQAPDDPIPLGLNHDCRLMIKIIEANFLKDADFIGNQDPYITFQYGDQLIKTKTMDDAGKHAVFNEIFTLQDILEKIEEKLELQFNAYDEDTVHDDWLGMTEPIIWQDLVDNTQQ